jgi:chromosome segregation ATPase
LKKKRQQHKNKKGEKMLSLKKVITFIVVCTWLCVLSGCNESNKVPAMDSVVDSFSNPKGALKAESNAAKYDQSTQANTSLDSAIELSQKYVLLSEECAKLKEKNKNITDENQEFKEKIASSQTQLDQTKKELSEANDLLVEMRIELNNWKVDILGFRDEMRDAEKAQLEALFKILTILGGQTNTTTIETTSPAETIQKENIEQQNVQTPDETNNAAENNS